MMEQDPESTQFTQTQRGKAKVRNGTRWGGGAALGVPRCWKPHSVPLWSWCSFTLQLQFWDRWFRWLGSVAGKWTEPLVTEAYDWALSFGAHFCKWGTRGGTWGGHYQNCRIYSFSLIREAVAIKMDSQKRKKILLIGRLQFQTNKQKSYLLSCGRELRILKGRNQAQMVNSWRLYEGRDDWQNGNWINWHFIKVFALHL